MIPGYVGTRGRKDAPVMIIGEAPGHQEVVEGKPFVGASGNILWSELKQVGIYPNDCYVTNVCKINPGTFPDGKRGAELMKAWAGELDEEMKKARPKVLLLVGGKALQRVTSFTSIKDWRGSVLRAGDLPNTLVWHNAAAPHPALLPPTAPLIIPTLHPAGIMRSKGREDIVLFKRDLKKVSKILNGGFKDLEMVTHFRSQPAEIRAAMAGAKRVYFDTEFNPETGKMFWVGMSCDGVHVYGFPWVPVYFDLVKRIMENEKIEKAAHNIIADARVMRQAGIRIKGRTYCTMIGMYALHPDQMVGLSPTARFYMDDVKYHKWMETTDPIYNAYDVSYGWGSWVGQLMEAKGRPVDPMPEMRARFRLIPICAGMEERGMPVDRTVQQQLIKTQKDVIKSLMKEVEDSVKESWERRLRGVVEELHAKDGEFDAMRECYWGCCKKHPKYYPSKKPSATCEQCTGLHENMGEVFTQEYEKLKKKRTTLKTRVKKWEEGFNYKSSEHLIWYLYTELRLPIQKAKGKITSNANAIERLSKLKSVKKKKEAFAAVQKMKTMQQANKAMSTFLRIPLKKGVAHPPYKIHGTVTGRLAGGEDKRGELDKVDGSGAFNVLNIPKAWRKMYVPRPGKCLVGADWKNQEGRLMAHFSQDRNYIEAFKQEDAGGVGVHSGNAYTVFGVDPADAEKVKIKFNGQMFSARHCAKVANHAWSYSPTPIYTLMKNFQLSLEESIRIDDALNEARPGVVAYKKQLVKEVLGAWAATSDGRYARCVVPGSRFYSNPFGWQVYYWGMGEVRVDQRTGKKVAYPTQAGELIAQGPQSTGASMFAESAYEVDQMGMVLYTGTYDNLMLEVDDNDKAREEAAQVLKDKMEKKWKELDGLSIPVDVEWGYNLGPYGKDNVGGLRGV